MTVGTSESTTVSAGVGSGGTDSVWARIDRKDVVRIVFVLGCAATVTLVGAFGVPSAVSVVIGLVGLLVGCWPALVEAWRDVRDRRMSMELSMLIAIAAAAAIGQWTTALVITAFVLAAEILEDLSLDRGRDALSDLLAFLPATVQVRDNGQLRTVELGSVTAGQVVVISPGGSVPVDGTIIAGRSSVDQSRITGESLPVDVQPGDSVYAGSLNQVGAVEIRADRVGQQSSYGRIIETVRAAQSSQSPAQRLADRFAAWLIYLALAGAAVTYLITRDLHATISVIVAGACGIAAGTPLAVLAAIARAARSGTFIRGGSYLERLSTVDTMIVDKTGTLTEGNLEVVAVHPADGYGGDALLTLAAAAESYSEHPIGKAIVAHATQLGAPVRQPDTFDYQPGAGLTARIGDHAVRVGNSHLVPEASGHTGPDVADCPASAVHIAIDDGYAGSIQVADTVRDSASGWIAELHRLGLRTIMVTGDTQATAQTIGRRLGIDDVRAELLPHEKLDVLQTQRAAGHVIAMVGDGVNDAPALAQADVGIGMSTGTDIAQESADVVLIGADLADLTRAIGIARRTRRIIMFNFIGTITVDLIGMVLAAFGLLGPLIAAVIHVGSESGFILNSARLIPSRRRNPAAAPRPAISGSRLDQDKTMMASSTEDEHHDSTTTSGTG